MTKYDYFQVQVKVETVVHRRVLAKDKGHAGEVAKNDVALKYPNADIYVLRTTKEE